jgi:hypothetical protein
MARSTFLTTGSTCWPRLRSFLPPPWMRCSLRCHGWSPLPWLVAVVRSQVPPSRSRADHPPPAQPVTSPDVPCYGLGGAPLPPWPRPSGHRPASCRAVGPCHRATWLAVTAGQPSATAAMSRGAAGGRRPQSSRRGLGGAPTSTQRVRWLPRGRFGGYPTAGHRRCRFWADGPFHHGGPPLVCGGGSGRLAASSGGLGEGESLCLPASR